LLCEKAFQYQASAGQSSVCCTAAAAAAAAAVLLLLLPLLCCCCCLHTATPAQLLQQFDMTFSSYHQDECT
jgi:hypothetical protein